MAEPINYYLILDMTLDPPVKDKAWLEAAIQKKLIEWTTGLCNPAKGLLYKSLLEKVPEIKKALLTDDAARDAIILDATRIARNRATTLIGAVSKVGSVTEPQVAALCRALPFFSEKTIREMIPVPIVAEGAPVFKIPAKPADPPIKPLDDWQMDRFEKSLSVLGKKDIYDFLGCPRTSTPDGMCAIADEELRRARITPHKTAETCARQELAGTIASCFKRKDAKEAYDLALKTYAGRRQLTEIFGIRSASKTIGWKAYQESIADCRAIGMSQEEAEYFVYDFYCLRRKCPPPTMR